MTGQLGTGAVGRRAGAPPSTHRVPSATSRLPLRLVFPPGVGFLSQARGRDGARSARCPAMPGVPGLGTRGRAPRKEDAIEARAGVAVSVAEKAGPRPSNFWGACRGH